MFALLNPGLKSSAGAEVQLKADGSYSVRLLRLSLEKQMIQIGKKESHEGSSSRMLKTIVSEPLAIVLTGKGVLIKKTARIEVLSEAALQQLFPAMQLTDFYVQHFPSGEHSFVAIIRKEIANTVIAAFKKQGMEVLQMSLGPFVLDQVLPQLNAYEGLLQFDGHQLKLDAQKQWQEYSYVAGLQSEFPIKVDMEQMPEAHLLAYAVAFQLILNDKLSPIEVEDEVISTGLSELKAKLKFQTYGVALLGLFFFLLMLNFLLFSHYNGSNEELLSKAGQQSYVYENRQKLETEVKGKENLVKKLGWNGAYPYAYLCDQIGSSLPKELTLTLLQINPISGTASGMSKEKPLEQRSMKIKGQTSSVYALNNWIYVLKQKTWVKAVALEQYNADQQQETQVFTLLLNY